MTRRIWTIGHSTRKIDVFISLLEENGIRLVVDVRSLPGSRRYPQFNKETLAKSLKERGIRYNASFRGYADYMETEAFHRGVERLLDRVNEVGPTAIMCAEAVWWRCHRAMISDYLKTRGVAVIHIVDASKKEPHPFTPAARIVDGALSYASDRDRLI